MMTSMASLGRRLGCGLALLFVAACSKGGGHGTGHDIAARSASIGETSQTVTVTPTCVTIQRGLAGDVADAHIADDKPAKNWGSSNGFSAGAVAPGSRLGLVRYDLGIIPAGATVTQATATFQTLLYGDAPVRAHRVTQPWSEATVTHNSFGNAYSAKVEATFPEASTTSADLTSLVRGWVNGSIENHGILLERDLGGVTVFASSEYLASARPAIEVCYLPPGMCQNDGDCASGWCVGGQCGPTPTTVPAYTNVATYPTTPVPNPAVTVLPPSIGQQCFLIPGGLRCANNPGVQSWFASLGPGSIVVSSGSGSGGGGGGGGGSGGGKGLSFGISGSYSLPGAGVPTFDVPGFSIPWPHLFSSLDFDWLKHLAFLDIDIGGTPLFSTSNGGVTISRGRLDLSGDFRIHGSIDPIGISALGVSFTPQVTGEISVNGTFSAGESQSGLTTLWEQQTTWVQLAGPIPVVEILTVGVDVGYEICTGGAADIQGGATMVTSAQGGFNWNRFGLFTPIAFVSAPSFTAIGPTVALQGAASLRVFFQPRVSVSIYGLGGPEVALRPYARFGATFQGNQCPPASWELAAGISLEQSGDLAGFGMSCIPPSIASLALDEVILSTGTAGPCIPGLQGLPASCTSTPAPANPPVCSSYPPWPPGSSGSSSGGSSSSGSSSSSSGGSSSSSSGSGTSSSSSSSSSGSGPNVCSFDDPSSLLDGNCVFGP